ncbi:hypothetical protein KUM37_26525 [Streptomonospora sp. NEAU-YY374]|nr:hypothetical protein [Streptomonospora nanhaiensis]MBX9387647.1 hypothetical protein [Streptomonospora nanhaiensis]
MRDSRYPGPVPVPPDAEWAALVALVGDEA